MEFFIIFTLVIKLNFFYVLVLLSYNFMLLCVVFRFALHDLSYAMWQRLFLNYIKDSYYQLKLRG
jgi:hypothetical protein